MKGTNLRVSCYAEYDRTENGRNIGHYLAELINLGETLLQNFLLIELKFSFIVKAAELVFPTTCNRKKNLSDINMPIFHTGNVLLHQLDCEIMDREGPLLHQQSPRELKMQNTLNNFSLVSHS